MKKRIFFIVQQLNLAGSAEYLCAIMAKYLCDDYDVFIYSLETITNGKVNPSFGLNSRIRINSLNLPLDYEDKIEYINKNRKDIENFFLHSSFENDIFFVFTRFDSDLLPHYSKKIWVDGFEDNEDYAKYDFSIFLSKKMLKEKSEAFVYLQNRFIYMNPCARFDFVEDFKFHGNHLFAVTKLENKKQADIFISLVEELKKQSLKFLLTISCHGTYLEYFKDLISTHEIEDYIELSDFDSIKNGLSNADLLIYTSKSKFLPMTLVEAIVNSVPIICASKNEYAKELIRDCGVIVKNDDLIDTIVSILKDKIKLSKMKFATYESSRRFSSKDSLKSLLNLISVLDE